MKNICAVKMMYSMEEQFNEEICIDTLRLLFGDWKYLVWSLLIREIKMHFLGYWKVFDDTL